MKESQNKEKDNCLNSIPFFTLGVVIFVSEFLSIVLNILCLIFTTWKYLKSLIKLLNIICLGLIGLTLLINIIMFCLVRNIKKNILYSYNRNLVTPIFLIIFYIIIVIFNIVNAIYLSINLHVADYPEYGGRKRDQSYIDSHPDEFGNVEISEFVIVSVCPSLISLLNLLCIIITVLYRNKIVLLYNKTYEEKYSKKPENDKDIKKKKSKDKKKQSKKRKNSIANMKISSSETVNYNETDPEHQKVKNKNNELIKIKINNSEDGEEYEKKDLPKKFNYNNTNFKNKEEEKEVNKITDYNKNLPDKFYFGGRIVQNNDENNEIEFNLNTQKRNLLNSKQGTKSTL